MCLLAASFTTTRVRPLSKLLYHVPPVFHRLSEGQLSQQSSFRLFYFTPQSATHLVRWMNFDFCRPSLHVGFLVVVFSHVLIYS